MIALCASCGKEMDVIPARLKRMKNPSNITCSMDCKSKLMSVLFVGEGNPNYGKKWNDDARQNQSNLIKSKVDAEYRLKCSEGRSGKVFQFTDEHKTNMRIAATGRLLSEETKRIIGRKSSEKFTEKYKAQHRVKMELIGKWIPLENLSDYNIYYKLCEWDLISEYIDSVGYNLYEKSGLYSGKNGNVCGFVRDHIYSRRDGFNNKVFPLILKHPCNLQFITNNENIIKSSNSNIILEKLFIEIEKYTGVYGNHNHTLHLINNYREGKRYER